MTTTTSETETRSSPPCVQPAASAADRRARVLRSLRRYGWNPTSFQILDHSYRLWFSGEAVVAYVDTGRALVVAGPPVCPPASLAAVTRRFVAAAARRRRAVAFFGVHERFLTTTALPATPIGEVGSWEPRAWPDVLARVPSLREQLRRARAKRLRVAPAGKRLGPLLPVLRDLRARWLATHPMAPMSFLATPAALTADPAEGRTILVAWHDLRPVGYVCLTPIFARRGVLVQEWVRDPDAPNGTTELLLDAAFHSAARDGLDYVTLGLSPLAGRISPWLRAARVLGRPWFDFDGLSSFKAKFRPQRRETVALAGVGASRASLLFESLRVFAGGSMTRFGVATLLKFAPLST